MASRAEIPSLPGSGKGSAFSDWSDVSGRFRTVALPSIRAMTAINQTQDSAVLSGEVISNGGESIVVPLAKPLVSENLSSLEVR